MKRLAIAVAVVVAAVVFYKLSYPTYTYRYLMTVNVEVDGKLRSGSSVIEVKVSKQPVFLPGVAPLEYTVRGEAVYVDLGGQRSMAALLASGNYAERIDYPSRVVPALFKLDLFHDRDLASLPALRGRREVVGENIPTLVTAPDANDSTKLKVVRPDQFENIFGPGVHWRGVVIEMTTDAVTRGIETRMPFLIAQKNSLMHVYDYPNKFTPHYEAFIR